MIVMKEHDWFDSDVQSVTIEKHRHITKDDIIHIHGPIDGMMISKQDVIALAKEFNLIVFEKYSQL